MYDFNNNNNSNNNNNNNRMQRRQKQSVSVLCPSINHHKPIKLNHNNRRLLINYRYSVFGSEYSFKIHNINIICSILVSLASINPHKSHKKNRHLSIRPIPEGGKFS